MAEQSYVSDELTHFIGRALPTDEARFQLFLQIIEEGWLRASHREQLGPGVVSQGDGRKKLSSNEAVISTTLCFCDIPAKQLAIHIGKYGPFGIAFSKALLVRRGASPVFYIASNAANAEIAVGSPMTLGERFDQLYRDLAEVSAAFDAYVWEREPESPTRIPGLRITFGRSSNNTPPGQQALGKLHALESDLNKFVFSHIKFFTAELPHEHEENYYMEREWRKRDGLAFSANEVAGLYDARWLPTRILNGAPRVCR
jgi:hypothetical protein